MNILVSMFNFNHIRYFQLLYVQSDLYLLLKKKNAIDPIID